MIKDLEYYRLNCEENYLNTPMSVLRYISELKKEVDRVKQINILSFDDWCLKYVKAQGEDIYLYNSTAYSLNQLMFVYKKIKELNLID